MATTVSPIDTKDRAAVVAAYTNSYLPTVGVAMGWTGDAATCTPGVTSADYHDATQLRVNYYRAMAGLSSDIDFDAARDTDYQSGALMLLKNGLSHGFDPSALCYTAGGNNILATEANIASGAAGAEAVGAYIGDASAGNEGVGHRRWILYPRQEIMATGSVTSFNALGVLVPGGWGSANAYSETILGNSWMSHPDFVQAVCWPCPRYFPYQILPASPKRWSLSVTANASVDFSAATVTMTKDNGVTPVTTVIQALEVGFGDKTLVWTADVSLTAPGADTDYEVTVADVIVGTRGQKQTFTYTVTVIVP